MSGNEETEYVASIHSVVSQNANIQSGQWNYVSFTYDNNTNTGKLYINDKEVGSASNVSIDMTNDLSDINIGHGDGQYVQGVLDDVSIFNTKYTDEMIRNLKNDQSSVDAFLKNKVIGHWDFNDFKHELGTFLDKSAKTSATTEGTLSYDTNPNTSNNRTVAFDGSLTNYLTVDNSESPLSTSNLGVSVLVRPTSYSQTILSKPDAFDLKINSSGVVQLEIGNTPHVAPGALNTSVKGHFDFNDNITNLENTSIVATASNILYDDSYNETRCLSLNGTDSFVNAGELIPSGSESISVSMWVNLNILRNEPNDTTYTLLNMKNSDIGFDWNVSKKGTSLITNLAFTPLYNTNPSDIIKTEFFSSNRDGVNNLVKTQFRINAVIKYSIESVCYQERQSDYATSATLFDVSKGTDSFTVTGPNDVVVSTPYSFMMDDTTSQWVYYRFAGHTEVFEIEIEDIYRYGWVATQLGWGNSYFSSGITLANRNNIYALAYEDDTTVIATDSSGNETSMILNKYHMTPTAFVADAVSVRANNPIQLGAPSNTVHNERFFVHRYLRSTRFIFSGLYYSNTHNVHIYVYQDNTTIEITRTLEYQNGTPPMIVVRNKGTYMIRFGTSTNMPAGSYDSYHTLTSTNVNGSTIISSNKPISVTQSSNQSYNQVTPATNSLALCNRYNSVTLRPWWCFDDPTKYEGQSFDFIAIDKLSVIRTLTLAKYENISNWGSSGDTQPTVVKHAIGTPSDVYFAMNGGFDGDGRSSVSFLSLEYLSTEYMQILNTSSGNKDPMYYLSLDTGVQGLKDITIDSTTRLEINEVLASTSDFTSDKNSQMGLGVRYYKNASYGTNLVHRTTSENTYFGSVTNINNKENFKFGNIPNVRNLLFTPL